MNKIVLGISLIGIAAVGCTNEKHIGDPEMERNFQGDWASEYVLDNEDIRMRVSEKITFDTLDHSYQVELIQRIIYPVSILYAEVHYEGTWSADKEKLYGTIDPSSVKMEFNPNIREEKQFKVYQDFVNNMADCDYGKDVFIIRSADPGHLHLIDMALNVTHDMHPQAADLIEQPDSFLNNSVSPDSAK